MAGAGGSGGRGLSGPLTQLPTTALPTTALLCQPQEPPSALQGSPLSMGRAVGPFSFVTAAGNPVAGMAVLGLG